MKIVQQIFQRCKTITGYNSLLSFVISAPKCPHLGKALCINRLRKAWTSGELGDLSACKQCEKEQDGREKEVEEIKENKVDSDNKENGPTTAITSITSTIASMTDENAADAIWICLQCANRGCSR